MIQRIQSVLLFLAAGLCVAFLFFPTWMVSNPDMGDGDAIKVVSTPMGAAVEKSQMSLTEPFKAETLPMTANTFLILQFALTSVAALLLLVTIFLYSNRPLQIKLGYAAVLLLMSVNVLMIPIRNWLQEMGGDPTIAGDLYQSLPQWGLGVPLVALLLTWFAIKRIQHDEKLVKGMDRFR